MTEPTSSGLLEPGPVLITGASGFLGAALVDVFRAAGFRVRISVRASSPRTNLTWTDVEIVEADMRDRAAVTAAMRGQRYLVHAAADYRLWAPDMEEIVRTNRDGTRILMEEALKAGVERIVYLSGLFPAGEELSDHLRSRLEVEEVFLSSSVPATILRAAMIVGAGSTSFEVMRRTNERLLLTPVPAYLQNLVQPVAVVDVLEAIAAVLRAPAGNRGYDLGGPDRLSYADLLAVHAEVAGLRRQQVTIPLPPSTLTSRATALLTGMDRETITALVDSLAHDMVCDEDDLRGLLPKGYEFMPLRQAIERSLGRGGPGDGGSAGGVDVDPQAALPTD